jgi:single-strand DNA-binding protein
MNYNRVVLAGNLTRDPELRATQGGTQVAKFGMAISRKRKDQEETCFVDVTAWGKQAETIAQYMQKGRPILVEGRLEFSQWQAQDGSKRSKLEVVCENFQFVGSRDQGNGQQGQPMGQGFAGGQGFGEQHGDESDIPF